MLCIQFLKAWLVAVAYQPNLSAESFLIASWPIESASGTSVVHQEPQFTAASRSANGGGSNYDYIREVVWMRNLEMKDWGDLICIR